ncbi:hypothetical protein EVAR_45569_1 [Eumeta japonica]|uniref:Uncharacterized protein n=1 Tax=Eumeta variegata TaxID=151549 RepID=A0A4C1YU41_EUMVA|nr:hypothetical protein EVAR_45569_1 [Eumeta japonica]
MASTYAARSLMQLLRATIVDVRLDIVLLTSCISARAALLAEDAFLSLDLQKDRHPQRIRAEQKRQTETYEQDEGSGADGPQQVLELRKIMLHERLSAGLA